LIGGLTGTVRCLGGILTEVPRFVFSFGAVIARLLFRLLRVLFQPARRVLARGGSGNRECGDHGKNKSVDTAMTSCHVRSPGKTRSKERANLCQLVIA
jgi:hypothetical protein